MQLYESNQTCSQILFDAYLTIVKWAPDSQKIVFEAIQNYLFDFTDYYVQAGGSRQELQPPFL